MSSPAPAPLGNRRTTALGAPGGHVFKEHLDAVTTEGRSPVIVHPHGVEPDPRGLAEATGDSLAGHGWNAEWGLGGVCANMEDAAAFAAAGYTWFVFDLSPHLESRADAMTLDELDAAIVALEDADCYAPGWHERYLDAGIELRDGSQFCFADEVLARAAVKFGRATAHASQLNDAIRTIWSGRDASPDIEISIASSPAATTAEELLFVTRELLQRGIGTANHLRVAPSFGSMCEPGGETSEPMELPPDLTRLRDFCPPGAMLAVPAQIGRDARWADAHHDHRDAAALAALRIAAKHEPPFFREWLAAARDAFPSSRDGRTYLTTDDDVRFLPEVGDDELATTFLDQRQGRQLLLVTWDEVFRRFGGRLTALHA